jgi:hypothetical protein
MSMSSGSHAGQAERTGRQSFVSNLVITLDKPLTSRIGCLGVHEITSAVRLTVRSRPDAVDARAALM